MPQITDLPQTTDVPQIGNLPRTTEEPLTRTMFPLLSCVAVGDEALPVVLGARSVFANAA